MKKIVLVMITLLAQLAGMAQNEVGTLTLTPKIGMNLSTMTQADIYYMNGQKAKPKTRHGLVAGAEVEYQALPDVALSAGLLYSQQGCRYENMEQIFQNYKLNLDYLSIPLMVNYRLWPGGLCVMAGVQPSFAVNRQINFEEYYQEQDANGHITASGYRSMTQHDHLMYRAFDFSFPLSIYCDLGHLRIECRYIFSPFDATKMDLHEKNRLWQITLGYRFEL